MHNINIMLTTQLQKLVCWQMRTVIIYTSLRLLVARFAPWLVFYWPCNCRYSMLICMAETGCSGQSINFDTSCWAVGMPCAFVCVCLAVATGRATATRRDAGRWQTLPEQAQRWTAIDVISHQRYQSLLQRLLLLYCVCWYCWSGLYASRQTHVTHPPRQLITEYKIYAIDSFNRTYTLGNTGRIILISGKI